VYHCFAVFSSAQISILFARITKLTANQFVPRQNEKAKIGGSITR
jgi:hypothetical protein